jgi:hypothetical protein
MIKPIQLTIIEMICAVHSSSDKDAGALFYDLIRVLDVDIEGVGSANDATAYLNRKEHSNEGMFA